MLKKSMARLLHRICALKIPMALLASFGCGLITDWPIYQVHLYAMGDFVYLTSIAATYMLAAYICLKMAKSELKNHHNLSCSMIGALSFCMLITAIFNLIMLEPSTYYALIDLKEGSGLSWKNAYRAVEFAVVIGMIPSVLNKIIY